MRLATRILLILFAAAAAFNIVMQARWGSELKTRLTRPDITPGKVYRCIIGGETDQIMALSHCSNGLVRCRFRFNSGDSGELMLSECLFAESELLATNGAFLYRAEPQ